MEKFAKLYQTDKFGQILVTTQLDDDGHPEISYRFGVENGGNITISHSFSDTDEGYDKRDANFEKTDLAKAVTIAELFCEEFGF